MDGQTPTEQQKKTQSLANLLSHPRCHHRCLVAVRANQYKWRFLFKGGGFSLSFAGPITGGLHAIPQQAVPQAAAGIDLISIVAAYLLILDQINIIGTLISHSGFTIVVSGPIFGESKRVAYSPEACEFIEDYTDYVQKRVRMRR